MIISETIAAGIAAIAIACGALSAYAIRRGIKAETEALDLRIAALEVAVSALRVDGAASQERLDRRITNLQKRRSEDRQAADANLIAVRNGMAERIDAIAARMAAVEEASPSFSIID